MAKINKQILGQVHGALGEITFRSRNGKAYLATKPDSFTPGMDEKSVARRERFGLSIKLAKAIYSAKVLRSIWEQITPEGLSAYNQIMRTNYSLIGSGDLSTSLVRLTPMLGFNLGSPNVELGPLNLSVDLQAIGEASGIDVLNEPSLKLVSVIYLGNPTDTSLKKTEFITYVSEAKATDLTTALQFSNTLSDVEQQMLAIYQIRKGFFTVVSLDAEGNAVHYSNTFVG